MAIWVKSECDKSKNCVSNTIRTFECRQSIIRQCSSFAALHCALIESADRTNNRPRLSMGTDNKWCGWNARNRTIKKLMRPDRLDSLLFHGQCRNRLRDILNLFAKLRFNHSPRSIKLPIQLQSPEVQLWHKITINCCFDVAKWMATEKKRNTTVTIKNCARSAKCSID